jgi:crotonobetainyl-CoA:carnitine CoA-transferase CaiB-like acyl-CoA transferase
MRSPERHGPLAGVRVVAIERMLAAPLATQILADLGADVIKVEQPGHGDETRAVGPFIDGVSHYFASVNRGKRSIVLDLKHPEVGEVLGRLVETADVVVENLRPGRLDTLGLGFEWMSALAPRLILCSISGFGSTGSWSQRPAFDLIVQALTGLMSVTGEPESGPTKIGLPISDLAAGLWAVIGINAHLAGPRSEPVHLDLSMFDATLSLETYLTQLVLSTDQVPGQVGSHHHSVTPYGRYRASDGWIVIALQTGVFWRRFCVAIGRESLIYDERFRTTRDRVRNRGDLERLVAEVIAGRTVAEWERFFLDEDIPGARVSSIAEALQSAPVMERGLLESAIVGNSTWDVVGSPIRTRSSSDPPERVPGLGAETYDILAEIGLDPEQISRLGAGGLFAETRNEEQQR